MHPGQRRALKRRLIFIAVSALAGMGFVAVRGIAAPALGAAVGAAISTGIIAIDRAVATTRLGARVRRLPLLVATLIVEAAYLTVILPTLALADILNATSIVFSILITLVFTSVDTIGRLIGWRVLGNVLIGGYRRPVHEDRIFLFLDLAGSTGLAERLGETRVQELVAQFYFDIARPIAAHGGEIYQYRGDEISVTWRLAAGTRDGNCVACAFAIRDCIAARADWYRHAFGAVPEFRIGLHGGPVVAGEVGDERREIMYFGDTINVSARIEALAKDQGRAVCISGDLLGRLKLPARVQATPLGRFQLRGKHQQTEVFSLATT